MNYKLAGASGDSSDMTANVLTEGGKKAERAHVTDSTSKYHPYPAHVRDIRLRGIAELL